MKIGLLKALGVVIAISGIFAVIGFGVEKWEKHECLTWVDQSQEFIGWEATNWQVEQCAVYGIDLSEYLVK